jgi:hypothetical protein
MQHKYQRETIGLRGLLSEISVFRTKYSVHDVYLSCQEQRDSHPDAKRGFKV